MGLKCGFNTADVKAKSNFNFIQGYPVKGSILFLLCWGTFTLILSAVLLSTDQYSYRRYLLNYHHRNFKKADEMAFKANIKQAYTPEIVKQSDRIIPPKQTQQISQQKHISKHLYKIKKLALATTRSFKAFHTIAKEINPVTTPERFDRSTPTSNKLNSTAQNFETHSTVPKELDQVSTTETPAEFSIFQENIQDGTKHKNKETAPINITFQQELHQVFTPNYSKKSSISVVSNILIDLHDFRFVLNNEAICALPPGGEKPEAGALGSGIYFMVIVHSAVQNIRERNAIRSTWGSVSRFLDLEMRLVFLLGSKSDDSINEAVQNESAVFGDIVSGNFEDTYRNLSYKHIMGYKWVTRYCSNATWVVKTDDDIFVDIFQLFRYISGNPSLKDLSILGPIKGKEVPERSYRLFILPNYKWATTIEEYPLKVFPKYCIGTAYLITTDFLSRIELASQDARYFWIDDLFVTGILREIVQRENEKDPGSIDDKILYVSGGGIQNMKHDWSQMPIVIVGLTHTSSIMNQMQFLWEKAREFEEKQ